MRCGRCQEFIFSAGHHCAPAWQCETANDDGYGPITVYSHFADEAATKYADQWDQDERTLLRFGGYLKVKVTSPQGKVSYFNVSGEAEPVYHAYAASADTHPKGEHADSEPNPNRASHSRGGG